MHWVRMRLWRWWASSTTPPLPPKCRLAGFGAGEGGTQSSQVFWDLLPMECGMKSVGGLPTLRRGGQAQPQPHQQSHTQAAAEPPFFSTSGKTRKTLSLPTTAWEDTGAGGDFGGDTAGPLGLVGSRGTSVPHLPSILNPKLGVTIPQHLPWVGSDVALPLPHTAGGPGPRAAGGGSAPSAPGFGQVCLGPQASLLRTGQGCLLSAPVAG